MITMPIKERKPISSCRAVSPSDKEKKIKYTAIQYHKEHVFNIYFQVKIDQKLYLTRNDVVLFL